MSDSTLHPSDDARPFQDAVGKPIEAGKAWREMETAP